MQSVEKVIQVAKGFHGVKESPANSNNVIFNTHYYGREVSGSSYPWCCVFVWDVFRLAGMSDVFCGGQKTAYCPEVENYYKTRGRFFKDGKRGDLVLMDFGKGRASHIGILLDTTSTGYLVIEGNTSVTSNDNGGKVMIRERKKNVIRGFARPVYPKDEKVETEYYEKCSSKEKSIVDGLKSIGESGTFSKRFEIAKKNGMTGYAGTAEENTKLLKLLKTGKLKK